MPQIGECGKHVREVGVQQFGDHCVLCRTFARRPRCKRPAALPSSEPTGHVEDEQRSRPVLKKAGCLVLIF